MSEQDRPAHQPVMLDRVVDLLGPALGQPDAVLVDATLGLGGHSAALLARHPALRLIGVDRDPEALQIATNRLTAFADRIELRQAVYDQLPEVVSDAGLSQVSGVLFDLGVSSLQLDSDDRGFAYSRDTPLDMRMDPSGPLTAEQVLADYPAADLARIFRWYGEERFAQRIAAAIVARREHSPLVSTSELAELVRDAIPAAARRTGGNPAKRVFQALRIEVNGELVALERALPAALDALRPDGRIVVLAYHSLEDRLVKQQLAARSRPALPAGVPMIASAAQPELQLLTRGAETADAEELAANPRAASARLRAAVRLRAAT